MAYDYNGYLLAAQGILKYESTDVAFIEIVPRMIEYAELRIYREIDALATLASQTTTLTASTRTVALPTNVVVCQSLNVITPSTTTNPDLGTRNPLDRVSVDFLNAVYPSVAGAAVPKYYAILGNPTISTTITAAALQVVLGPAPLAAYTVEVIGTVRPSPLSQSNTTTYLSTYQPELFLAASMVFGFGYQRDFGGQTDDPQAAMSWEKQYTTLRDGVNIEEMRKKSASVSWSPYMPTPPANTQRERASAAG